MTNWSPDAANEFARWASTLSQKPHIMKGEMTFPGTELTVRKVGELLESGASRIEVLQTYPYLNVEDLDYARVFVRTYPSRDPLAYH